MSKATRTELETFKDMVGSNIFSVKFTKKNGDLREMVCRLGVKKHLQGGELKYDPASLGYITVFDMQVLEYRTINVSTLKQLTFNGVTYEL